MDPFVDLSLPLKKKKKKPKCVSASEVLEVNECSIVPSSENELTEGISNMSVDPSKATVAPNDGPDETGLIFYSDDDSETLNDSLKDGGEIFYSDEGIDTYGKESSVHQIVDSVPQIGSKVLDTHASPAVDSEDDLDFSFPKKKKKKKPLYISESADPEMDKSPASSKTFDSLETNNEPDYTYDDLLARAFTKMRETNPSVDGNERKKLVIKPPQILRAGAKKSSFVNFLEICRIVHREPAHLQSFLLVELGTTGSVDGNGHLLIKGRFQQKQIESVLRKYIKEYVTCHSCRSPNTMLLKETRLYFKRCESCGSRTSVPAIKSGFQAVISKRANNRNQN